MTLTLSSLRYSGLRAGPLHDGGLYDVMRLASRPAVEVGRGRCASVDTRGAQPQAIAADFGQAVVWARASVTQCGWLAVGWGRVGRQLVELLLVAVLLPPSFSVWKEEKKKKLIDFVLVVLRCSCAMDGALKSKN